MISSEKKTPVTNCNLASTSWAENKTFMQLSDDFQLQLKASLLEKKKDNENY